MQQAIEQLDKAQGHSVKALEKLYQEPSSRAAYLARLNVIDAIDLLRHALELLKQEQEAMNERTVGDETR